MIALFLQTLLLMGAAYFMGAVVACFARRTFHRGARLEAAPARPVEPLPEMMHRATSPGRFGRSPQGDTRTAEHSAAPVPAAQPPMPAQDLKQIRPIDSDLEARLNQLGVRRYEQIAAWMKPDIRRISEALGLASRISRENWIEQAQVLAKGGATQFASRAARGQIANAAPTSDEGEPLAPLTGSAPTSSPAPASVPEVSLRAAFAKQRGDDAAPNPQVLSATVPIAAVPIRPAAALARDNLQRIGGVDAEIEKTLAGHGVTRYSQIAHWSPVEVQRFESLVGTGERVGRENWVEQAQILSRGGDTAFSRDYDRRARGEAVPQVDAAATAAALSRPARADMGALRSVRSAAYQGSAQQPSDAATRLGSQGSRSLRGGGLEDLKRIRGIGVLIEKKLNQMGVLTYEQIANWTAEEIDRVSQSLDFKGRIERENWVEQARILASGGATEFSRRVDRGEVETSRYRP